MTGPLQELDGVGIAEIRKYSLRDRSRLVKEARYSPPKEEERMRLQCVSPHHQLISEEVRAARTSVLTGSLTQPCRPATEH